MGIRHPPPPAQQCPNCSWLHSQGGGFLHNKKSLAWGRPHWHQCLGALEEVSTWSMRLGTLYKYRICWLGHLGEWDTNGIGTCRCPCLQCLAIWIMHHTMQENENDWERARVGTFLKGPKHHSKAFFPQHPSMNINSQRIFSEKQKLPPNTVVTLGPQTVQREGIAAWYHKRFCCFNALDHFRNKSRGKYVARLLNAKKKSKNAKKNGS